MGFSFRGGGAGFFFFFFLTWSCRDSRKSPAVLLYKYMIQMNKTAEQKSKQSLNDDTTKVITNRQPKVLTCRRTKV